MRIHHKQITKTRRWCKVWKVNRKIEVAGKKGSMVMQQPVGEYNLAEEVWLLYRCGEMGQWLMMLPAGVPNATWV